MIVRRPASAAASPSAAETVLRPTPPLPSTNSTFLSSGEPMMIA